MRAAVERLGLRVVALLHHLGHAPLRPCVCMAAERIGCCPARPAAEHPNTSNC